MTTAVTIGNFDGVHVGHRALIDRARAAVRPGVGATGGTDKTGGEGGTEGEVVALAFHPSPLTRLRPHTAPAEIEPWELRVKRLLAAGAGRVEMLSPTPALLGMTPETFVDWLVETHRPTVLVEGADFRFGKGRAGTVQTLRSLAGARGVRVEVVGPVMVSLCDQSEAPASSSLVRWLLGHGRVRDAAFVLGRAHELPGVVVPGDRLGRTIGFPTVNLRTASMTPGDGVYAGKATLPDGREVPAAIHVGGRPAVGSDEFRVEAHLLEPAGGAWTPPAGMPESGWACTLRLIGRVRDVVPLDGLEALKAQIARDCVQVRRALTPMSRDVVMLPATSGRTRDHD